MLKTTQQNNKELITLQAKMGVQTIRETMHSKPRLSQFSPLKRIPIVSKTQREANSEHLPYFLGYKMGVFSFQNNPKNLDLCYQTDLDFWDCLGWVKLIL